MKSVRLTSVTLMVVFCLLAVHVQLTAQELQKDSTANWIHDRDEIVGSLESSTPDPVALANSTAKLSPLKVNFGSAMLQFESSRRTVTLTNVGSRTLSITGIAVTGTDQGDFNQTDTCGTQLAAGASCTIEVTFEPNALGTRTAALSVSDNGGGSPQTVVLIGTGVAASCVPLGEDCFGPGGPGHLHCCHAPIPHHSFCSSRTGWGICLLGG